MPLTSQMLEKLWRLPGIYYIESCQATRAAEPFQRFSNDLVQNAMVLSRKLFLRANALLASMLVQHVSTLRQPVALGFGRGFGVKLVLPVAAISEALSMRSGLKSVTTSFNPSRCP